MKVHSNRYQTFIITRQANREREMPRGWSLGRVVQNLPPATPVYNHPTGLPPMPLVQANPSLAFPCPSARLARGVSFRHWAPAVRPDDSSCEGTSKTTANFPPPVSVVTIGSATEQCCPLFSEIIWSLRASGKPPRTEGPTDAHGYVHILGSRKPAGDQRQRITNTG